MDAIQMAAERDKGLWQADAKAIPGNRGGNDCSSVFSHKRRRSFDDIEAGSLVVGADISLSQQHPEVPGEAPSFEISRPYLCTNFDLCHTGTMYNVCNGSGPPENTKSDLWDSKCIRWCSGKSIQIARSP